MSEPQSPAPEFLTVRELAALLRIKERKVYELASSGDVPVSRVTGKLLFPERAIRAWIAGASTGAEAVAEPKRPEVFLGSHDPLLEWALRQSKCGLASRFDGSHDGLTRFVAGEGVAAALHIHETEGKGWNVASVTRACATANAVLVAWARRRRGLVLRKGDAAAIRSVGDLKGRVVAPRQAESGTQVLFERLLSEAGVPASEVVLAETAPSETDAVQAVAGGAADACFGLEAVARLHDLGFVPIVEERFDLLVDRAGWFEPPFQRFWAFCGSEGFARHAGGLAGYDLSELGQVRWNA
ncbi:MAG: helix-turn-helix transcriptional regulator [Paracoccaceae bacterium]|nr:helix-turn-helix transcriptional regulator [Paracoccaceae bacterium]